MREWEWERAAALAMNPLHAHTYAPAHAPGQGPGMAPGQGLGVTPGYPQAYPGTTAAYILSLHLLNPSYQHKLRTPTDSPPNAPYQYPLHRS